MRDRHLQIRLGLLLVGGDIELQRKWHRTALEASQEVLLTPAMVDAQIAAVNEHLAQMGFDAVPHAGVERIKAVGVAAGIVEVLRCSAQSFVACCPLLASLLISR